MSDNAWPVPIPGQRTNRQAVTESERKSSTVMHLRRLLMGESMNGGVERLVWAAALLIVSTVSYLWLGLEGKWTGGHTSILSMSHVGDWLQAAHYSFRAMTLLKPEDVATPVGYSRVVHTMQSLLGPLFLGLFALAVRQRLKR